jgi:AraC-like DNA-binding protein
MTARPAFSDGERRMSSFARASPPAQRVGVLAALPGLLRELGVEPGPILAAAGMRRDALDSPESRVPFDAIGRALELSAERTGCQHFGLLLGSRFRVSDLGTLGALALSAPTVGDALRHIVVNQHLMSSGSVLFLTFEGPWATLGIPLYQSATAGFDQYQDGLAMVIVRALKELVPGSWRAEETLLSRRRPASVAAYRAALPGRLRFDAEFAGVRFPVEILDRPLATADAARFEELEAQIAAFGQRSLLEDLRRALRVELVDGNASATRVAQMLALHRRTLNRRLRTLGTTFQAVLDEVRHDAAQQLLRLTDLPLTQIAASLGYSDVASFNRAFRRWAGTTPGRFRASPPGKHR